MVRKLSMAVSAAEAYTPPVRILLVEDEPKLAAAIREGLETQGYQVTLAQTGEEGFYAAEVEAFDLLIFDVMLPNRDGIEIVTSLRRRNVATPTLLLTAKDAIEDRVRGLDGGADDYLVKPFAYPELLARIRALTRRGHAETQPLSFAVADLRMDVRRRVVTRASRTLELSPREFELLEYLLRNQGCVVSREMLARDVWNIQSSAALDNVIDVQIRRLRRKLDDPYERKLLQTVRGVGFVLREEDV
jgi:two-component system copper resistance phosphate regulon response regulator CusR